MCDQQSSRAAAYPVASWETACEVAECCKETDKNLISCQLQLLPQLVATTTATTPLGTEAAVTEPQTTEATAAAETTTAVTETTTEATTTAEATASAADATTTAVAVEAGDAPIGGGTTISPTVDKTTTTLAPVIEEPNAPSASSHIKAATCVMGVAIAVISFWM